MKKKNLIKPALACATILLCAALTACDGAGKNSGEAENGGQATNSSEATTTPTRTYAKDMDLTKYITLKDYKNFRVEREKINVDESQVDMLVDNVYYGSFPKELGIMDRAVAEGDRAIIDYEGKIDGVAFDGGTAQEQVLEIGSHTFIDGFESGLIGVMPGETVDLNLRFPDDYRTADLAGKPVVFTVKVHSIIPEEKLDEAVMGIIDEVNSVADLRQYVYDYLYSLEESNTNEDYEEKIIDAFLDEMCEFKELPQEWIDYYRQTMNNNVVVYALQQATDPETVIQNYYGMGLEEFLTTYSDIAVRRELAMLAVAKNEGLSLDDDAKLDAELANMAALYDEESVDSFLANNGITKEDFRQDYSYELALEYILELAKQE